MASKKSDVLRSHYSLLCTVLASANQILRTLAGKLYEKCIIDVHTKNEILERKGLEGANLLVDLVMMKIDLRPERLEIVLQIMEEVEDLQDILEMIRKELITKDQEIIPCMYVLFSVELFIILIEIMLFIFTLLVIYDILRFLFSFNCSIVFDACMYKL